MRNGDGIWIQTDVETANKHCFIENVDAWILAVNASDTRYLKMDSPFIPSKYTIYILLFYSTGARVWVSASPPTQRFLSFPQLLGRF